MPGSDFRSYSQRSNVEVVELLMRIEDYQDFTRDWRVTEKVGRGDSGDIKKVTYTIERTYDWSDSIKKVI